MMGRAKGKASTDCADAREEDREAHEWTLKRGARERGPSMLIEDAIRSIRRRLTPAFASLVCGKLEKALEMVRELEDAARRRNVGSENSGN